MIKNNWFNNFLCSESMILYMHTSMNEGEWYTLSPKSLKIRNDFFFQALSKRDQSYSVILRATSSFASDLQ